VGIVVARRFEMIRPHDPSPSSFEIAQRRLDSLTPPRRLLALYQLHSSWRQAELPIEFTVSVTADLSEAQFVVQDFERGQLVRPVDAVVNAIDQELGKTFPNRAVGKSEIVGGPFFSMHP
jgi:hypothetical protein